MVVFTSWRNTQNWLQKNPRIFFFKNQFFFCLKPRGGRLPGNWGHYRKFGALSDVLGHRRIPAGIAGNLEASLLFSRVRKNACITTDTSIFGEKPDRGSFSICLSFILYIWSMAKKLLEIPEILFKSTTYHKSSTLMLPLFRWCLQWPVQVKKKTFKTKTTTMLVDIRYYCALHAIEIFICSWIKNRIGQRLCSKSRGGGGNSPRNFPHPPGLE